MNVTFKAASAACIIFLIVGMVAGALGLHAWQVSDLKVKLAQLEAQLMAEKAKPPQVKETVKTETQTKLQYVPGETVYLPSPTEANPNATQAAKLDGKFTIGKPNFVYELNGKPGQFAKADDERYVLDKNMIRLDQSSTITIKADIPTVDLTRRNSIGPYITTESYGIMASRETDTRRFLFMGGKKWDEKNGRGYEAGGAVQFKF
ncbi:MAG: hypothetical protein P4N41_18210 [Negativicutes bacterium]|nr:hypothetical protein [Negativicutes bacterium]